MKTCIAIALVAACLSITPEPASAADSRAITPEVLAQQDLTETNLTVALLSFIDMIAYGEIDSMARFLGTPQRYERALAEFNTLSDEDRQKKNEEARQEFEDYKAWYPSNVIEKIDLSKDLYPQLVGLGELYTISEYERYLKHDPHSYLDNMEDTLALATLLQKGKRTIAQSQFRARGRGGALALDIAYSVPRGLLSAARMKKYYGDGVSYCVVLTKDVERIHTDYDANRLLYGHLDPSTDLEEFREMKSSTIKCNLVCRDRGHTLGVQVGRGHPFTRNSFGSFCLFKYNFRTPELGSITFWDEEKETNNRSELTVDPLRDSTEAQP